MDSKRAQGCAALQKRRGQLLPFLNQTLKHRIAVLCISALLCQQGSYAAGTTIHPLYPSDFATRTHMKPKPIQHFGFDGQLTDSQSQWQFLGKGYRAYNPMLHRFMAQDSMSPFDKGGLNGYVFARNNPIMAYDPTGHFDWSALLLQLVPHTIGGFAGWAVSSLITSGLGVAAGAWISGGGLVIGGSALVGALASVGGASIGQGIDTGNYNLKASFATVALLGGAFGAVGTYLGSRGPSGTTEAALTEETPSTEATCFTKDTLVQLANKKEQAIANIQLGTMVMTGFPSSIASQAAEHIKTPAPQSGYKRLDDVIESIVANTWQEVDLKYFSMINNKRYQNTIALLRPIAWLHAHGADKVGNTIRLSLPEFGIANVKAYVIGIKPTKLDMRGMDGLNRNARPVIGKFKRYTLNVRTYTFRDNKGHIHHIHATPNHPFYVQNKQGFVPIAAVKDIDTLVGLGSKDTDLRNGGSNTCDVVHLVCDKGTHTHCGKRYSDGKHPMAVYNLEVYRQHVFRVGSDRVLVHNCSEYIDPSGKTKGIYKSLSPGKVARFRYLNHDYVFGLSENGIFFKTEYGNNGHVWLPSYIITWRVKSEAMSYIAEKELWDSLDKIMKTSKDASFVGIRNLENGTFERMTSGSLIRGRDNEIFNIDIKNGKLKLYQNYIEGNRLFNPPMNCRTYTANFVPTRFDRASLMCLCPSQI